MKKLLSALLSLALVLGVTPSVGAEESSSGGFTDVSADAWYASYVNDMAAGGYVTGVDETTYDPNGNLSVAQFTAMIANAFYGETLAEEKQNNTGAWWDPFFSAVDARGGMENTKAAAHFFNWRNWDNYADVSITRCDVAAMIANLVHERGIEPMNAVDADLFIRTLPDTVSPHYHISVATAYQYKLMTGRANGEFDGDATLTRGEAAAVLSGLLYTDLILEENVEDFYVEPEEEPEEEEEEPDNESGLDISLFPQEE